MTEIEVLKDIYFFLVLTCSILILVSAVKLLTFLFGAKKAIRKISADKKKELYEALFEQDNISKLVEKCEHDLRERPNSALALYYMVKVSALRKEFMRMSDYLERLHLVDPRTKKTTTEFSDLLNSRPAVE
ncbi:hypothetical protein N9L47_04720 [Rhodobacteraceae bacterium]|nr:hypothetical protein [Paracoccaceae bacterium]